MTKRHMTTLALALVAVACGQEDAGEMSTAPAPAGEVNIYSSRHYDTDLALYEDFTAQTGIKVNRIEAGADALIERISAEGEYTPADILITVDAGRLWRAVEADILAPTSSEILEARIPENLRHPEGLWFGLSKRARVIIYNAEAGKPEPLDRYEDLADPAHRGKICMRSSSNIYNTSLLASIIAADGIEAANEWAEGVVANFARPPQGNDTGNVEAVAAGECQISIANTYYIARMASDGNAAVDGIGIVFPNQEDRGTHVNISGAGITAYAPNRENAVQFLEYLTNETAQAYFANGNNEYPVVAGVAPTSAVAQLGTFAEDQVNAAALGENQAEAIRVFDSVGWQ